MGASGNCADSRRRLLTDEVRWSPKRILENGVPNDTIETAITSLSLSLVCLRVPQILNETTTENELRSSFDAGSLSLCPFFPSLCLPLAHEHRAHRLLSSRLSLPLYPPRATSGLDFVFAPENYSLPEGASERQRRRQQSDNPIPLPTMAISSKGAYLCLGAWLLLILGHGLFADYNTAKPSGDYSMWQDVQIMIKAGFGFLMSFLSRSGFTSTGTSLMICAFVTVWSMMNFWFWRNAIDPVFGKAFNRYGLGVNELINADFCSAAVLISFGAVIGRISALQLVVMAAFEVVFYSINEAIGYGRFVVADIGGSMIIHAFGAYFGLTVSYLLDRPDERKRKNALHKWESTPVTDTLAMLGTILLWCFWPSFNSYYGAGGPISNGGVTERAVLNTTLSLCAATFTAFFVSSIFGDGKVNIVDIQNASLAGGVAIGASANMYCMPHGTLMIGSCAGLLSTVGYRKLQPYLDERLGLKDTCGVHNLHGMPAILGAFASIVLSGVARESTYDATGYAWDTVWFDVVKHHQSNRELVGYQFACLAVTLGIAVAGGAITAFFLRQMESLSKFYDDSCEWVVEIADDYGVELRDRKNSHSGSESGNISPTSEILTNPHSSLVGNTALPAGVTLRQ